MNIRFFAIAALVSSVAVFGQDGSDAPFQVKYASNLAIGDSVINLSNDGGQAGMEILTADATVLFNQVPMPVAQNGNLCVNVYAFTPDEQMASCCTCYVTPNGLNSLSVKNDLASNPLTPVIPSAMVIKLLGTDGSQGANSCNAARPGRYAFGLLAWGTTLHALPVTPGTPATTYALTETQFAVPGFPSRDEYVRLTSLCGFIKANGSGYGICKSCRLGGLGAASK